MANSQLWDGTATFDQVNSTPFKFYIFILKIKHG